MAVVSVVAVASALGLWLCTRQPQEVASSPAVSSPAPAVQPMPSKPDTRVVAAPVTLGIPAIDVEAPVVAVGLTPDGAMESPEGRNEAGWFEAGPMPGEEGSAVIAGHSGYRTGSALFDDLSEVGPGDWVFIVDETGSRVWFRVRETRLYDRAERPPEVFASSEGEHLNLITCTGTWDAAAGTHSQRLVVFADLEEPGERRSVP
jgi:LPXTG-site transpeptidase (sortase) family protein